jgi:hypothetical protein
MEIHRGSYRFGLMKFEVAQKPGLPRGDETAREAESTSIKNSVLLRRPNGQTNPGKREKHHEAQTLPGRLNSVPIVPIQYVPLH